MYSVYCVAYIAVIYDYIMMVDGWQKTALKDKARGGLLNNEMCVCECMFMTKVNICGTAKGAMSSDHVLICTITSHKLIYKNYSMICLSCKEQIW